MKVSLDGKEVTTTEGAGTTHKTLASGNYRSSKLSSRYDITAKGKSEKE